LYFGKRPPSKFHFLLQIFWTFDAGFSVYAFFRAVSPVLLRSASPPPILSTLLGFPHPCFSVDSDVASFGSWERTYLAPCCVSRAKSFLTRRVLCDFFLSRLLPSPFVLSPLLLLGTPHSSVPSPSSQWLPLSLFSPIEAVEFFISRFALLFFPHLTLGFPLRAQFRFFCFRCRINYTPAFVFFGPPLPPSGTL